MFLGRKGPGVGEAAGVVHSVLHGACSLAAKGWPDILLASNDSWIAPIHLRQEGQQVHFDDTELLDDRLTPPASYAALLFHDLLFSSFAKQKLLMYRTIMQRYVEVIRRGFGF